MKKILLSFPTYLFVALLIFLISDRSILSPASIVFQVSVFTFFLIFELDWVWKNLLKLSNYFKRLPLFLNILALSLTVLLLAVTPGLVFWLTNLITSPHVFVMNDLWGCFLSGWSIGFIWFWTRFFTTTLPEFFRG